MREGDARNTASNRADDSSNWLFAEPESSRSASGYAARSKYEYPRATRLDQLNRYPQIIIVGPSF
jgi:hypothetical protein